MLKNEIEKINVISPTESFIHEFVRSIPFATIQLIHTECTIQFSFTLGEMSTSDGSGGGGIDDGNKWTNEKKKHETT